MKRGDVISFPGSGPAAAPPRGDSPNPRQPAVPRMQMFDYLRVLSRRRGTIATAFTVAVTATVLYLFTMPPVFQARAQVLIDAGSENVVNFKEVVEQNRGTSEYYQTQYRMLQNRPLIKKTLDDLNLWDHPEFGGPPAAGSVPVLARIKGAVSGAMAQLTQGLQPARPAAPSAASAETTRQARGIDAFLGHLKITPIRNSRLVDVVFESTDPEIAARAANALSKGYIEQTFQQKLQVSQDASSWLEKELATQRDVVENAELALQRYREDHDAVSVEDRQNIVVQKLADLNAAVTRAKTTRIEKEAAFRQLQSLGGGGAAVDAFPLIIGNTFIQQLKTELAGLQRQQAELLERYGERYPDVIKTASAITTTRTKLDAEIAKVVESVRSEYLITVAQERELVGALESQKQEALALNRKGIEYAALQREAASTRQMFEGLLQRLKETGISGDRRTSDIRIVEPAEVPQAPVRPNKTYALAGAILGGALFAIALAFLFEYVDDRLRSPEEIRAYLGLPFLGLLPEISGDDTSEVALQNATMPRVFQEALRTVRTNLMFSSAEEGARCIVVTSATPGEGKTVVASNLALALAQAGRRVLLIDADMRRPRVHEVFGIERQPGLSNLLVGDSKPSDAVHRVRTSGSLAVLPAGTMAPNPAELLGAARFTEFLRTLDQCFDWVIIDSPPVHAVADASVIGHATSGVLFVIGADMTSRRTAQAAIEQLESARAKVIGAVLNRADLERNSYYYSPYYHASYGEYHAVAANASGR